MRQQDIRAGRATVVVHTKGGWALPGRGRTDCPQEAMGVAVELDKLIARAARPAVEVAEPAEVTRRLARDTRIAVSRC